MKLLILSVWSAAIFGLFNLSSSETQVHFPVYEAGVVQSQAEQKPLLILFTGNNCSNNWSTNELLSSSEVQKMISEHYVFRIFKVDDPDRLSREEQYESERIGGRVTTLGLRNVDLQIFKFGKRVQPHFVILDGEERVIDESAYIATEEDLMGFLVGRVRKF